MAFKITSLPSQHPNQVNYFQNIDEVYQTYKQVVASHEHQYRLVVPTDDKNVTKNEIETVSEFQESIKPLMRQLTAGRGDKVKEERLGNFVKLLTSEPNGEEAQQLRELVDKVANWKGFHWAASIRGLGLEFFTEWTHTAARVIDNLHAFGYADYLVTKGLEDRSETWQKYLTEDVRAQKIQPFQQTIEELVVPQHQEIIYEGAEGMSISTALQDFRRKTALPINTLLMAIGDHELEAFLSNQLKDVQEKMAFIKDVMRQHSSIEQAYQTMKSTQPAPTDLQKANNYRRECGGTGFLVALQQAIKGKGVSRAFYLSHRDLIENICTICNEMDKNNFEILLKFGTYEGDAIPSPYAFFATLHELTP